MSVNLIELNGSNKNINTKILRWETSSKKNSSAIANRKIATMKNRTKISNLTDPGPNDSKRINPKSAHGGKP